MKKTFLSIMLCLCLFSFNYGQENGHWDKNGIWQTDKDIMQTYKLPDLSTGFLVSKNTVYSVMGIELYDRNKKTVDFLIGSDIIALTISKRFSSILETKIGVWGGFSFEETSRKGWTFGVSFLLSKF